MVPEGDTKIISTSNATVVVNNLTLKTSNVSKKDRHNRHRRKVRPRDKEKIGEQRELPQFGYDIQDIDDFLTKATLDAPANIPVVLALPSVLYQTRIGGYQSELALPLGMVVNAVFKNQHWLYVQTPHAEEGYVSYAACLPLGIIPNNLDSTTAAATAHCWDHCSDVFGRPSGNQTDTEKISVGCGGSSSSKSTSSKGSSIVDDDNAGDCQSLGCQVARRRRSRSKHHAHNRRQAVSVCGEQSVDRLYLRATANSKRLLQLRQQLTSSCHDNTLQLNAEDVGGCTTTLDTLLVVRCDYEPSLEQPGDAPVVKMPTTAMANVLTVSRGDVVSLLAIARQPSGWFWVRTRGGVEGFIPAAIVGHGFL